MKTKKVLGAFLMALAGGLIAVFVYSRYFDKTETIVLNQVPARLAAYDPGYGPVDFTFAAEQTVHAVVHVTTKSKAERSYSSPFDFFFGPGMETRQEPVVGIGSGVIISANGYIVTNNHVVKDATDIHVKLNDNREYDAKLIGADPSTDLAVIKISAENLQSISYGNSDILKLGEWVLAVGNPFNLTSTVTAGIISAKGRNLNIVNDQYHIESFLQTDAALNPGNSGGALVNIKGELIGINTAIISPSGGYAGNSFAIPVSIVSKVVSDIIEFGTVQRAVLGVVIQDVDADIAKSKNIDKISGVFVKELKADGAAEAAGIKSGDVIVKVNNIDVATSAALQEQISKYRPKDNIKLTVIRDGKEKTFDVMLKNLYGDTGIVKASDGVVIMGAKLAEVTDEEKSNLGIKNGVKLTGVEPGKFMKAGVEKGFIITRINSKPVGSVEEVRSILTNTRGGVYIEGIYPNGVVAYYAFGI
jgi:serine protease Do